MADRGDPRSALILYGSESGNAQDIAEDVGRVVERQRYNTTVIDLDSTQIRDLIRYTVVVFVVSTTGQGEFPQNARVFWKALLSSALKPGILRKLRFASFGLGDSSYAQFNVAHRMLHGRLVQLGAQSFCDRGEGNEQHPEGHNAGYRDWIVKFSQHLHEVFPLPPHLSPVPDEVFIEPKWKLDHLYSTQMTPALQSNGETETVGKLPNDSKVADTPSVELVPARCAYVATVRSNDRITPVTHFQDVRLLKLHVDEGVSYGPGAVAVVYPKNFPEDIQSFIDLMHWEDIADQPLQLVSNTSHVVPGPSPLRHLDLTGSNVTMRWLLENVIDFMSIPRRSFFAALAYFAKDSNEDEKYQKERLLELANPELIDELWDYTTRPKRTILEVMMDFTTVRIPWRYSLSVLPIMRGRQFSIASGGALALGPHGETCIQLLVAVVDPPSPIIKWRRRYGVCTRYIAILQKDQHLNIGIQQGYLDVQRTESDVPIIMVGPGTGLAPLRSMIYQRLAWNYDHEHRGGQRLSGDVLFFGCRNKSADYFFRDEWEHLARTEGLRVHSAFSRDEDEPRQYVQDHIRRHAASIRDTLLKHEGKVYVCGSSGNMPKGVRRAFIDVLVDDANGIDTQRAESILEMMESSGRYKQETW